MVKDIELACLGRLAVDLYGVQQMTSLEEARSFRRYLGGSSGNLAVGAARLGLRTALVSATGDDPMGRYLRGRLGAEGVDDAAVATVPGRKTALAFLGMLGAEAVGLDFYRADPADAALSLDRIPEGFLDRVAVLAVTGTHFADPETSRACMEIIAAARRAGARIVLDIDLRAPLWAAAEGGTRGAAARVGEVAALAELVVGNEDEFRTLADTTDLCAAVQAVRARTGAQLLVKLGVDGAALLPGEVPATLDAFPAVPGRLVRVENPVGAGDAFLAGFLSSWLRGGAPAEAIARGNGAGALVVSRHACSEAMPFAEELDMFLAGAGADDPDLAHLHRVRGRRARPARVMALACDHRAPFEALTREFGRSHADAAHFKSLVGRAALQATAARGLESGAMLLDTQFGAAVLEQLGNRGWWLGRPVEVTRSRPLRVEAGPALAADIATWNPAHVAKVLVWHHPDDPAELAGQQIDTLHRLDAACRDAGIEWMLEIVPPVEMGHDDATLERCVAQMYQAGLRPDYWKLPAMASQAGWDAVAARIRDADPWCRGVVVLGLDQPMEVLAPGLRLAARQPVCAGFAVGRTIFGAAARAWFAGQSDDATAIADMARRYGDLLDLFAAAAAAPERNAV